MLILIIIIIFKYCEFIVFSFRKSSMFTKICISNSKTRLQITHSAGVVKAHLVDGLPSGYVRFLLDLDGKPGARRHGFEMEGTLTTKGTQ